MKFKVIFTCERGYVCLGRSQTVGLGKVATIRKELDVQLPLERIDGRVEYVYYPSIEIELTEQQAIKAGRFADESSVTVTVPTEALNHCAKQVVKCKKDQTTGEVLNASMVYTFNSTGLVDAWIEAGAPENWDI